jgi:hypothetical protein
MEKLLQKIGWKKLNRTEQRKDSVGNRGKILTQSYKHRLSMRGFLKVAVPDENCTFKNVFNTRVRNICHFVRHTF